MRERREEEGKNELQKEATGSAVALSKTRYMSPAGCLRNDFRSFLPFSWDNLC